MKIHHVRNICWISTGWEYFSTSTATSCYKMTRSCQSLEFKNIVVTFGMTKPAAIKIQSSNHHKKTYPPKQDWNERIKSLVAAKMSHNTAGSKAPVYHGPVFVK